ncbi:MAG: hypothetical protein ACE5EE_06535 [Fidelibacterota bacterium]
MKRLLLTVLVPFLFELVHMQTLLPRDYTLRSSAASGNTISGLQSNVIIEIVTQGDSAVWLGTGRGLAVMWDSTSIATFNTAASVTSGQTSQDLPEAAVSGIAASGDTVIVAFASDTTANGDQQTKGDGIAINFNAEDTTSSSWFFLAQPRDAAEDTTFFWEGDSLSAFPITLTIGNIIYDLAITSDYFWAASFYGGLRRLARDSVSSGWKRVPLPEDAATEFLCGADHSGFELNSQEPELGGNRNHRVFSVLAYGDTLWVGTAKGINRGILDDSGCINWRHYRYPDDGISGNWVVGIAQQKFNGERRIWAVTLRADEAGEVNGISYTPDDGQSWIAVTALRGERAYNVSAMDSLVYVATQNGLWRSGDGVNFALYEPARDAINSDEILSNTVYTAVHDTRPYYGQALWVGTPDGLARTPNPSKNESIWGIFRTEITPQKVYAYPNPFSPYSDNVLDGDGYVRFHHTARRSQLIQVAIYNFAMEKVAEYDHWLDRDQGALKWDGKDSNGRPVANGPYFCRLNYDDEDHWVKLIVVK